MIFNSFHIQDKALFQQYLQDGGRVCEHAFANLFAWQLDFGNRWTVCHDRLIVRSSTDAPGEPKKYMLLPDVRTPHLPDIIRQIQEDAGEYPFCLARMSEEDKHYLECLLPDMFMFDNHRDDMDYVYDAQVFKTFKGRKLAAKRNHVNKFKSLYQYHYEELTSDLFEGCLRLERQWRAEQHDDTGLLEAEERAIRNFFAHYRDLDLIGGALYVEGTLAAFTFGSPINNNTFDIHIEKADVRYEGVFPMMSHLFAQQLPTQYQYINREEDLGLPGLRQSKLSYHPLRLEPKFSARLLNDDLRGIIRLWQDVFHDDEAFVHAFLSRYYHPEHAFLRREAGRVVAQCMLVPCDSEMGRVGYLYAIATAEEYREKGLAAQVTEEAVAYARSNGFAAVALIPANDGLRHYYARFGFEPHPFSISFTSDLDLGMGDATKDYPMVMKLQNKTLPAREIVCMPEE